jgi:DNA-binding beta-propeller fold protein YncE
MTIITRQVFACQSGTFILVACGLILGPAPTEAQSAPDMYFGPGSSGGISRVNLADLSSAQQIIPSNLVNTSTGIAVDYVGRQLYWIADTQCCFIAKIRRAELDGTNVQTFVVPSGQPAEVQIDPFARKLYWTSRITNSIEVINLNGTNQHQLLSTIEPRGMDLDLVNRQMYWVEFESNRIRRANLDGSNVTDVLTTGITRPFDVAVDPLHQRLYWTELGPTVDNEHSRVWMANLDGTSPQLIADQLYQPLDVGIDEASGFIYWGVNTKLFRANLDGSGLTSFAFQNAPYVNLALDVPPIVPEPSVFALDVTSLMGALGVRCRSQGTLAIKRARNNKSLST